MLYQLSYFRIFSTGAKIMSFLVSAKLSIKKVWQKIFYRPNNAFSACSIPQKLKPSTTCCINAEISSLQIIKEVFLPAFQELKDCLQMTTYIMNEIKVNEHILDDDKYLFIFSVEEVNRLAREGMPFRDAYKKVGLDIEAGKFTHDKQVHHTHEGSIGNLCNDEISALMQQVVDGFNFCGMEQAEKALLGR
jgi:argininosuccinate lyase